MGGIRGGWLRTAAAVAGIGLVGIFGLSLKHARDTARATDAVHLVGDHLHELITLRDGLAEHTAAQGSYRLTRAEGYRHLALQARQGIEASIGRLRRQLRDSSSLQLENLLALIQDRLVLHDDAASTGAPATPVVGLLHDQAIHGTLQAYLGQQRSRLDSAEARLDGLHEVQIHFTLLAVGLAAVLGLSLTVLGWQHLRHRTAAERELARKSARLTMLFDHAPLAIVAIDDERRVEQWNQAAERLFGWRSEDVLGKPLPTVPPEKAAEAAALHARLEAGEIIEGLETGRGCADGRVLDVALYAARVQAPGEAPSLMCAYMDLTERTRAERELAEARERAEQAARAKSAFLATMSHEIRTPMNGVLGMAQLLLDEGLPPAQREMVMTIHRSGAHLLEILNDILDYSKLDAGRLELEARPFDPVAEGRDVLALLGNAAQAKGLELRLEALPSLAPAYLGDAGRVRQIITNFVGNAIKFTATGAVRLRLGPLPGGTGFRLAVTDTGIGIPPEKQRAIFDKFTQGDTTTARRFGGTGLGLAICRDLATLMGGQVGVESQPGVGSTFWCELPLAAAEQPAGHSTPVPLPPGASTIRLRVLVVDDNPVNRKVASLMLARLDCDVELAEDGAQAVARVEAEEFDAVFMDCHMPVLDGFAATRAIRALPGERGQVPVIAFTASVTEEEQASCRAAGMQRVLGKPLTRGELAAVIEEVRQASIGAV
jgi:PAS domain S-box-containing protein